MSLVPLQVSYNVRMLFVPKECFHEPQFFPSLFEMKSTFFTSVGQFGETDRVYLMGV